jgi:glycerol-3-phosphate cytidylyltransferase
MLVFKEVREQVCEYLIVGLHTDPSIDRPRTKNRPVMSVEERRILLQGIRYVDEIWEYDTEAELLVYLGKNARQNGGRIDVRIVGEDYKGKDFTGKHLHIPVYYNARGHDYSTTQLRRRVADAEALKQRRAA